MPQPSTTVNKHETLNTYACPPGCLEHMVHELHVE